MRVLGSCALLCLLAAAFAAPPALDARPGARIRSIADLQAKDPNAIDPDSSAGKPLFATHCAVCHLGAVPKAPSPHFLGMMAPDAIVTALTSGVMRSQGASLAPEQKIAVAEYLTHVRWGSFRRPPPPPVCSGAAAHFDMADVPAPIGWGLDNRRFVPAAIARLARAQVPHLALKWSFAFPAASRARSQPTVAWGTLYVGSQDGTVYAFDPASGCARWTTRLSAEVRNAIVPDAASHRLYFGDLLGRVHALDAFTGRELWSTKAADHPDATITGTPALGGGVLLVPVSSLEVVHPADPAYPCCSFRGQAVAMDPATGAVLWRAYTAGAPHLVGKTEDGAAIEAPSGAPVWTSPTYDAARGRFYFGSGENYSSPADDNSDALFAVDARSGARVWHTQLSKGDAWNVGCMMGNGNCPREKGPDHDLSASPLLIALGGGRDIIVAGQKSGMVYGIDPADGHILWQRRVGHGGTQGGVHFGMAAEGTRVFVGVNDMADTHDARVYDPRLRGSGLHALDAATGRELWYARAAADCHGAPFCDPGISAAVTAIPGVVFAGHLDGVMRAYDARNGAVLWQVATNHPYVDSRGVAGRGGSMSGPGAAVWHGSVIFNSGYGLYSHMGGAMLLVFAAKR